MVLFLAHFKLNVSFGNCFSLFFIHTTGATHAILVVPHIFLIRHPRFGIVAYRRINPFLAVPFGN